MDAITRGNKAKALLEDEVLTSALDRMKQGILNGIESCPKGSREVLHELHDSLAFLRGFRRNLELFVEDGQKQEYEIAQEERPTHLGDISAWMRKHRKQA